MIAPSFGPWGGPATVVVYGDKGIGKSLDMFLVDPLAWTLGVAGSLKGARWFVGDAVYAAGESLMVPVASLEDVIVVLRDMYEGRRERRNLRIDDLTVLVTTTLVRLGEKYGNSGGAVYAKWDAFKVLVDTIKVYVSTLGVHVFSSTHVAQPHQTPNRGFVKGGPDIGGPNGMDIFLAIVHVIYKAEPEPGRWPYGACYRCDNPSTMWEFKDRHNVVFGTAPLNLREIMLAAGYGIPRFPGMEWQDEWADSIAAIVAGGTPPHVAFTDAVAQLRAGGIEEGIAYCTARDGLSRADLRNRQNPLSRAMAALATPGVAGGLPVPPPITPPASKK